MKNLTDQQKLEILCAYLPYGVEVEIKKRVAGILIKKVLQLNTDSISSILPFNPRPILRHQDDMTEEELQKLADIMDGLDPNMFLLTSHLISLETAQSALRYLHSLHIDTFGAIEAGFAVRKQLK